MNRTRDGKKQQPQLQQIMACGGCPLNPTSPERKIGAGSRRFKTGVVSATTKKLQKAISRVLSMKQKTDKALSTTFSLPELQAVTHQQQQQQQYHQQQKWISANLNNKMHREEKEEEKDEEEDYDDNKSSLISIRTGIAIVGDDGSEYIPSSFSRNNNSSSSSSSYFCNHHDDRKNSHRWTSSFPPGLGDNDQLLSSIHQQHDKRSRYRIIQPKTGRRDRQAISFEETYGPNQQNGNAVLVDHQLFDTTIVQSGFQQEYASPSNLIHNDDEAWEEQLSMQYKSAVSSAGGVSSLTSSWPPQGNDGFSTSTTISSSFSRRGGNNGSYFSNSMDLSSRGYRSKNLQRFSPSTIPRNMVGKMDTPLSLPERRLSPIPPTTKPSPAL